MVHETHCMWNESKQDASSHYLKTKYSNFLGGQHRNPTGPTFGYRSSSSGDLKYSGYLGERELYTSCRISNNQTRDRYGMSRTKSPWSWWFQCHYSANVTAVGKTADKRNAPQGSTIVDESRSGSNVMKINLKGGMVDVNIEYDLKSFFVGSYVCDWCLWMTQSWTAVRLVFLLRRCLHYHEWCDWFCGGSWKGDNYVRTQGTRVCFYVPRPVVVGFLPLRQTLTYIKHRTIVIVYGQTYF